ncbi:MAG TPA: exopolyphosphatase, partial [Actinomycetota bacterium]|nr:exopolyphosphatase [Actinomycetota bacterium]
VGRFARRARALRADRIRLGATSAVRDASNADAFLEPASDLVGSAAELIDGEREAELSFLGGTRGLDPADGPFLVVDVGGGSTEFVIGREPGRAERSISTQVGSVRLTERVAPGDPPTAQDLETFRRLAEAALDRVEGAVPVRDARTLVAVAGTATTLQACAMGLERYDPDVVHRSTLTLENAERALRDLAAMTNEERAAIPVMPPGRGDVIVAGAAILVAAMRRSGFDRALVSETDILDGLAFELLGVG